MNPNRQQMYDRASEIRLLLTLPMWKAVGPCHYQIFVFTERSSYQK
jgi:hypothetical protein